MAELLKYDAFTRGNLLEQKYSNPNSHWGRINNYNSTIHSDW